ncbi:hypothetical protein [Peptoniphilus genitalis]|uniref:hypothetical protein n=1 Tax=Peptoniphilus genitalis TaxID=3036303 RepID=UPI0024AD32EC|nr:hypothetical protein [Peptoniphilus sp. Marseille-Q7072]
MKYKSDLKKDLKTISITEIEVFPRLMDLISECFNKIKGKFLNNKNFNIYISDTCYELSYEKDKDLKKFDRQEILNYINVYYINDRDLEIDNFINDLITFKTYKDELDLIVENQNAFYSVLALLLALLAIATSVKSGRIPDKIAVIIFILLFALIVLIFGKYIYLRENKNSNFNKLKVVNNAIHVLEAIKDHDYKKSNKSE